MVFGMNPFAIRLKNYLVARPFRNWPAGPFWPGIETMPGVGHSLGTISHRSWAPAFYYEDRPHKPKTGWRKYSQRLRKKKWVSHYPDGTTDDRLIPLELNLEITTALLKSIRIARESSVESKSSKLSPDQITLVLGHVRLVLSLAGTAWRHFPGRMKANLLEGDDVLQEGFLGLCKAVSKVKPKPDDNSIIAFASDYIAGEISKAFKYRKKLLYIELANDLLNTENDSASETPSKEDQSTSSQSEDDDDPRRLELYFNCEEFVEVERSSENELLEYTYKDNESWEAQETIDLLEEADEICADSIDREILRLKSEDLTDKEIGVQLGIGASTVGDRFRRMQKALENRLGLRPCKLDRPQKREVRRSFTGWNKKLYVQPQYEPRQSVGGVADVSLQDGDLLSYVDDWHDTHKAHRERMEDYGLPLYREFLLSNRQQILSGDIERHGLEGDTPAERLENWRAYRAIHPAVTCVDTSDKHELYRAKLRANKNRLSLSGGRIKLASAKAVFSRPEIRYDGAKGSSFSPDAPTTYKEGWYAGKSGGCKPVPPFDLANYESENSYWQATLQGQYQAWPTDVTEDTGNQPETGSVEAIETQLPKGSRLDGKHQLVPTPKGHKQRATATKRAGHL